ncbi:hypothetical protein P152DRAFT_119412 [Eremomyces bilateralis CBS 781.70]|uniref:Uncharacterized protein n=1 Tax=Eremomyces bilateralis CBS 781.70 TaxID=1392243 RepID=A0A6G1GE77_9PEZI|nr:uncharacterized protein P152DRAFT_119412 [Eremomyces bilateralis CBS 781.70]KAF1816324.1 hypothetical protein P152DRAFT_119412 [Eremomyces bilateralis CBS 781.70]
MRFGTKVSIGAILCSISTSFFHDPRCLSLLCFLFTEVLRSTRLHSNKYPNSVRECGPMMRGTCFDEPSNLPWASIRGSEIQYMDSQRPLCANDRVADPEQRVPACSWRERFSSLYHLRL